MAGPVPDWRVELVEAHPDLFRPAQAIPARPEPSPSAARNGAVSSIVRACRLKRRLPKARPSTRSRSRRSTGCSAFTGSATSYPRSQGPYARIRRHHDRLHAGGVECERLRVP
jgi:hypothetical protein